MFERFAWLILAGIHAMPAIAFFRPSLLTRMYRLERDNPLFLLMQHRAALFTIVMIVCIWSIFDARVRQIASISVAISMLSFLLLYWRAGSPRTLKKIAQADLIGLPALAYVTWMAFA